MPLPDERVRATADEAAAAAEGIGFPVVANLGGEAIAHKTERGLVRATYPGVGGRRDGLAQVAVTAVAWLRGV